MKKFPPGPSLAKYVFTYFAEHFDYLRLVKRLIREYGDIIYVRAGNRHHYFINRPDYIEKVLTAGYKIRTSRPGPLRHALGLGLITSQGDLHRTMRHTLQPFFQKQAALDKTPVIMEETERILGPWKDGEVRDIAREMTHLTLGIILRILFGTNFEGELEKMGEAGYLIHLYMHQDPASHWNMLIEEIEEKFPFLGSTKAGRARRYIDDKIYGLIRARREAGNLEGADLLSSLLRIREQNPNLKELTDRQIRDEMVTMYIAGHETTSNALAWTCFLLSGHREVEEKLHGELDSVLSGRLPTAEDIPNLRYTRMVLAESMRLYPPVWTLGRRPVEDFELGDYVIPEKSTLLISPYFVHHDERFYPDPERFDPERFSPEEEAKRPKFTYFPFGGGNRKCIGEGLAWVEAILMLSTICQRWRLRLVKGHPIALEPLISLKPKYGMRMALEERQPVPIPAQDPAARFIEPFINPQLSL